MKMTCLSACGGDVKRAIELYSFLSDGITDIPDYTPTPPTTMQQIKQTSSQIFDWFKNNQGDIMQAIGYIQQIRSGQPITPIPTTAPPTNIPPIPNA
jgi:hypothetical protein